MEHDLNKLIIDLNKLIITSEMYETDREYLIKQLKEQDFSPNAHAILQEEILANDIISLLDCLIFNGHRALRIRRGIKIMLKEIIDNNHSTEDGIKLAMHAQKIESVDQEGPWPNRDLAYKVAREYLDKALQFKVDCIRQNQKIKSRPGGR